VEPLNYGRGDSCAFLYIARGDSLSALILSGALRNEAASPSRAPATGECGAVISRKARSSRAHRPASRRWSARDPQRFRLYSSVKLHRGEARSRRGRACVIAPAPIRRSATGAAGLGTGALAARARKSARERAMKSWRSHAISQEESIRPRAASVRGQKKTPRGRQGGADCGGLNLEVHPCDGADLRANKQGARDQRATSSQRADGRSRL